MTPDSIPVSPVSTLECRSCGAGAPVDEHFCPQCSRILALGRHGDYFTFFGLPRKLTIAQDDLERRFRELSRKFHPDYYYNALADRASGQPRALVVSERRLSRAAHAGDPDRASAGDRRAAVDEVGRGTGAAKVPPALLEEVFALNEELDEIREQRESGADAAALAARLERARGADRPEARGARAADRGAERAVGQPGRCGVARRSARDARGAARAAARAQLHQQPAGDHRRRSRV